MDKHNIFFTSDQHWGHKNICKYSKRPFSSLEEMNEQLIINWNNTIPKDTNAIIYHVGDIFLSDRQTAMKIRNKLNGTINLIYGNHEKTAKRLPELFGWSKDYYELKVYDETLDNSIQDIVLFHYPMKVYNKSHYGSWAVTGHSHGSLPDDPNQLSIDVGVDAIAHRLAGDINGHNPEIWRKEDYRPVSYLEIKEIMKSKSWKQIDHHGKNRH